MQQSGFAFAVSLAKVTATFLLVRGPDNPTLPVAMLRLLGRAGDLTYVQAWPFRSCVMVLCGALLLCVCAYAPTGRG